MLRAKRATAAIAAAMVILLLGGIAGAASDSADSPLFTLNTRYLTPVGGDGLPRSHRLGGCHPNPFNPSTTIEFALAGRAEVDLAVYDLTGRLVRRLIAGETLAAGPHTATWNGRDGRGRLVSAGLYLYRLKAGDFTDSKRMTLVK